MRPLWQILTRPAGRASANGVLACDECFAALEYLAELLDEDVDPKQLWHAAQRHLVRCPDCREHHRQRIHDLEAWLVESSQSRP